VAGSQADITRDIRVGERNRLGDSTRLMQQTRDIDDEARYERIFAACMKARGYALQE
jgi:hypothetical protein